MRRTVEADAEGVPEAALRSLADGPTDDETADGLTSEVPADAPEVSVEDGTATVRPDGEPSRLAAAQLVHTLTGLPGIRRVVDVCMVGIIDKVGCTGGEVNHLISKQIKFSLAGS